MENIYFGSLPAFGFEHLFVLYENSEGEFFVIRGGSGVESINPLADIIDIEIGQYTSSSRDWIPPEQRNESNLALIATGQDLREHYLRMDRRTA